MPFIAHKVAHGVDVAVEDDHLEAGLHHVLHLRVHRVELAVVAHAPAGRPGTGAGVHVQCLLHRLAVQVLAQVVVVGADGRLLLPVGVELLHNQWLLQVQRLGDHRP